MVETKNSKGLKDPAERGKRVVAYLTPEVMADLERVAKHYHLSKSEVIAEAIKDIAAQLGAKDQAFEEDFSLEGLSQHTR